MDHLLELGSAVSRFTELASSADGTEPVPACPDWTMRELTIHLGTMHRWAAAIVLSGQRVEAPRPIVTEPLVDRYAAAGGWSSILTHPCAPGSIGDRA